MTVSPTGQTNLANTIAAYNASGAPVGLSPTTTLQVIGNDGAGNVAVTTLEAGANVSLSQSGSNIVLASSSGASSGGVGVDSPVQIQPNTSGGSIPSGITITTAYTASFPALSAMQTISSFSITPKYQNVNGVGSSIQIFACIPFSTTNTSSMGVQLALYTSLNTATPIAVQITENGAMSTNSYDNSFSIFLQGQVFGTQNVPITVTLAASYTQTSGVAVENNGALFFASEDVPNTQSIVQTQIIPLGTTATEVTSSNSLAMTSIYLGSGVFKKQFSNSIIQICMGLFAAGSALNQQFWGDIGLWMYTGNPTLGSTPSVQYQVDSVQGGVTGISFANNSSARRTELSSNNVVSTLSAATYNLQISGYGEVSYPYYVYLDRSFLILNEILPLAAGGNIQSFSISSGIQTTATPYTATLSPQYSATAPIVTWTIEPRATGSSILVQGQVGMNAISGEPEGEVLYCFYTTNSPTATPFAVRKFSKASSNSGPYPAGQIPFGFFLTSNTAEVPQTIYVSAASLTSTNLVQLAYLTNCSFTEYYAGNLITGVSSVTAASGSYLTATTSSGTVTLNTTQASVTPSQGGLVSLLNAPTNNTYLRVNNLGTLAATGVPYWAPFTANVRLQFGGANVGQVVGTQLGVSIASDQILPVATGFASSVWQAYITIALNVTTLGTSTGVATVSGNTLIPVAGFLTQPFYFPASDVSGVALANNAVLEASYTSGTGSFALWSFNVNSQTRTQLTNASFTAPVQIRIAVPSFYTTTAPTG